MLPERFPVFVLSSISLSLALIFAAGCDTQPAEPNPEPVSDDAAGRVVTTVVVDGEKREIRRGEVVRGKAAKKLARRSIKRVMRSPASEMSVPPSKALEMLNSDGSSKAAAKTSSGLTGFISVSRADFSIEKNEFSVEASTTSDVAGKLGQVTNPDFASPFGASCENCTNLNASTVAKASGCSEGQTVSAISDHQGPTGTTSSKGTSTCE